VTGGLDFPTIYFFRGIRQETDTELTMWPYGDFGVALYSGEGAIKSVGANVGIWNSLHTGSSGLDGPKDGLGYETDFYATVSLGFGGGTTLATTYTAYTSPIDMFGTVKEISFKTSVANKIAPYGLVAFELGDTYGADGGNPGTYLELGVGPSFPLADGKFTVAIPVKVGFSLDDYYELNGEDNKFGFLDIGALFTFPLSKIPSNYGSWNLHTGVDFLALGDTTRAFNGTDQDKSKVVGLFGIGLAY
jgi:hypothetical protein